MIDNLKPTFRHLFTEIDNQTWCPVRLFGVPFAIIASNVYIGLSVFTVIHLKQPFDYVSFGHGLGVLWGVVSAMIVGKQWVEAKEPDDPGK